MAMRLVAFITVLLAGEAAFWSPPDPCSLTSTVTDANLTLSIPDGRFPEKETAQLWIRHSTTFFKNAIESPDWYD
jgi:hypothetical protein